MFFVYLRMKDKKKEKNKIDEKNQNVCQTG